MNEIVEKIKKKMRYEIFGHSGMIEAYRIMDAFIKKGCLYLKIMKNGYRMVGSYVSYASLCYPKITKFDVELMSNPCKYCGTELGHVTGMISDKKYNIPWGIYCQVCDKLDNDEDQKEYAEFLKRKKKEDDDKW